MNTSTTALDFLADWKNDFPEEVIALFEADRDATNRRARLTLANTPLSIGVMGQVKAGKSSFLNALLFDGKTLLPEAATPKTANLTRIVYAEKPSFTAKFYRPEDWALIEKRALSESGDEVSRAAKELVASAKNSGAAIQKLLKEGEVVFHAENIDGLMQKLNDYVGSDGRLTALVAETALALPMDDLKGIEIVDTPGMNDPVVSRTDKTREYMAGCDVVFFLARASQFLDESDQSLMTAQLPQKGIKRLILVGAQFDMALLDDGFARKNLDECSTRITSKLSKHAATIFADLTALREKQGQTHTAQLLRSVEKPIFASTHAWMIANQKPAQWSKSVAHTEKEISYLAKDSWKCALSHENWKEIANFEPLINALATARNDKEAILATQRETLETELAANQKGHWQQLQDRAESRLSTLQKNDLASLEKREAAEKAALNKISSALSDFLRANIANTKDRCHQLTEEVSASARRATDLNERTGYKRTSHSVTISDSKWYNPFSWGDSHQESYSTTTSYSYLAATDAIENLRYYVESNRRLMIAAFDDLIAPTTISAGLRRELLRAIDTQNPDFDAKGFRALIESALGNLKLPELDFKAPDIDSLFAGFSGEVKDASDMNALREKLKSAVTDINKTLVSRLSQTVKETSQTLEAIASTLENSLTARLAEEIKQLRESMADKENQIARLKSLIQKVKAA